VPSVAILALGLCLLPLTNELYGFLAVALLTGVGNGFGSGIVMTLGADFAPADRRGEFLGVWRFIGDTGNAGGPLAISFLVGIASLGGAALITAGFGLAGAVAMAVLVPETLRRTQQRRAADVAKVGGG